MSVFCVLFHSVFPALAVLSLHLPLCCAGEQGILFLRGKERGRAELGLVYHKVARVFKLCHHCTICCAWLHSHSLTETVELLLVISSLWL